MAYDRYDSRDDNRGYRGDRQSSYGNGDRNERGFFERAKDEVSSWFGDEEAERRRNRDDRMDHRDSNRSYGSSSDDRYGSASRGYEPRSYDEDESRQRRGRDNDRSDRSAFFGGGQSSSYGRGRDDSDYRSQYGRGGGESGGFGGGDYSRQSQSSSYPSSYGQSGGSYSGSQNQSYGSNRDRDDQSSRGYQSQGGDQYRPMTGDYGRGSSGRDRFGSGMGGQDYGQQQYGSQDRYQDQGGSGGSSSYNYGGWGDRDSGNQSQQYGSGRDYARSGMMGAGAGASSFGSGRSAHDDHYSSWRQRQIEDLDQDYDEYRREHQSRFENEFSSFRSQRQTKRQMLSSIREHFEVVDESGQHIGTVDKVRGDKVILTKNDPDANGRHRSFSCTLLDRVEDNKVYLTGTKDSIRSRLTEERSEDDDRGQRGGILGSLFGSDDNDRRDRSPADVNAASTMATTASSTTGTTGQTGEGPHVLDKSFSGTYDEDSSTKR